MNYLWPNSLLRLLLDKKQKKLKYNNSILRSLLDKKQKKVKYIGISHVK